MTKRTLHLQCELLEAAKKYPNELGVQVIVSSIERLMNSVKNDQRLLQFATGIVLEQIGGEREVSMDQGEFVRATNRVMMSLFAINNDYANLAIVLERLGEKVNY